MVASCSESQDSASRIFSKSKPLLKLKRHHSVIEMVPLKYFNNRIEGLLIFVSYYKFIAINIDEPEKQRE